MPATYVHIDPRLPSRNGATVAVLEDRHVVCLVINIQTGETWWTEKVCLERKEST